MKPITTYIPLGSDLVSSAFRRLDREILGLKKAIALSTLFSWNYESKLRPVVECVQEKPRHLRGWHPLEVFAACLALCLALCACGPNNKDNTPEIAGPCPGPGLPVRVVGAQHLRDGSTVILLRRN